MASREVSTRQTAHLLGVRLDEVYGLLWAGKLKGRKVDGRWRISEEVVQQRARQLGVRAVSNGRTKRT
jgi:hypothetical protein